MPVHVYEVIDVSIGSLGLFGDVGTARRIARGRGKDGNDGQVNKIPIYDNFAEWVESEAGRKLRVDAMSKLTVPEKVALYLL